MLWQKKNEYLTDSQQLLLTLYCPFQAPNSLWAELNSNLAWLTLSKVRLLIQTSNLIRRALFSLN